MFLCGCIIWGTSRAEDYEAVPHLLRPYLGEPSDVPKDGLFPRLSEDMIDISSVGQRGEL